MPFDVREFPGALPGDRATRRSTRRLVAGWLFTLAAMILVMVAIGGLTRLTGSGLSIMEWDPLMGALPPLSDAEWHRLFALYKQIPQYALVNQGFGLAGFKHIFWLEWVHRLWGRLIGLAVLVPLAVFWWRGLVDRRLARGLLALFVLGGLQGAVGWFMVASGFAPDATAVAPPRLAAHLALALLLYAAIIWLGLSVLQPQPRATASLRPLRRLTLAAVTLLSVTIVAGAFVAGLHAGLDYNTFPLMAGQWVPAGYADLHPFLRNLTENIAAVQFDHRLLATLTVLTVAAVLVVGLTLPRSFGLRPRLIAVGLAAACQYALGVSTLLLVVPVGLAVTHQVGAAVLLAALLVLLHALRPERGSAEPS
jgi:cytochrome c oxidase assembly protein subunit 15